MLKSVFIMLCYTASYTSAKMLMELVSTAPEMKADQPLPVFLGADRMSGCLCREKPEEMVVCYGAHVCNVFPRGLDVTAPTLKIKTTNIQEIRIGDLGNMFHLTSLVIEANSIFNYIEAGSFWNMSKLEYLSISYNKLFQNLDVDVFEGLTNLRHICLVMNGFKTISDATKALSPSSLPRLQKINLSENYFIRITEKDLEILNNSRITEFNLALCQLEDIEPKSFLSLRNLRSLRLGENNLSSNVVTAVLREIFKAGIKLRHLNLFAMGYRKNLPKDILNILANSTVRSLIFAKNHIEFLDCNQFPHMPNIMLLDLRQVLAVGVAEDTFSQTKFPNLEILLLSGNNFPGLIKGVILPQIDVLDLSSNSGDTSNPTYFYLGDRNFEPMKELRILNLSFNRILSIFNSTFVGLPQLKILNLKNCTIFHIAEDTFKSLSNLEVLDLDNNFFAGNENLTHLQFAGLTELRILLLNNCGISKFDDDMFFTVFPNLTQLSLRGNKLVTLTPNILAPLTNLNIIDLSDNMLNPWYEPIFKPNNISLLHLIVNNNKISKFTDAMLTDVEFMLKVKSKDTRISFNGNQFQCTCRAFAVPYAWGNTNTTSLIKMFFTNASFICSAPEEWAYRTVGEYWNSLDSLDCTHFYYIAKLKSTLLYMSPLIVITILLLLIVGLMLRYRTYVRYWIFLAKVALGKRNILNKVTAVSAKSDVSKTYDYDAFVSYSKEDSEFVVKLVSKLEDHEPFFKLCVYERDFEIGSFISESVLKCVSSSRYVILIVSDNFAKSQWCRWETQLAEYHRLFLQDDGRHDPLLMIVLRDVDRSLLTPTLKYLLRTKIYLRWHDKVNEGEFWGKIHAMLSKQM